MKAKNRPYSAVEEALLIKLYPETPTKVLAQMLGRSANSVYCKAKKMELDKSFRYLQAMGVRCAAARHQS